MRVFICESKLGFIYSFGVFLPQQANLPPQRKKRWMCFIDLKIYGYTSPQPVRSGACASIDLFIYLNVCADNNQNIPAIKYCKTKRFFKKIILNSLFKLDKDQ